MNLIDYAIATGEKQGNSEHFQNFLAINGKVNNLESENDLLKWMVNEKDKKLILNGLEQRKLQNKVSALETDKSILNERLDTLERINKQYLEQLEERF